MTFCGRWFVGYGVFLILCGMAGYLSNPVGAKTALLSGGIFGGLSVVWGALMLKGLYWATVAAWINTVVLVAAFAWRSLAGWMAYAEGRPKLFAASLLSLMLLGAMASLAVLFSRRSRTVECSDIKLGELRPFAEGGTRLCFLHPRDPALCLKVIKPSAPKGSPEDDENWREWRACGRLTRRLGLPLPRHLVTCHGFVSTDMGPALVADMVYWRDSAPAAAVGDYVQQHGWDNRCRAAMRNLRHFLLSHLVTFRDVRANNFLLRELPDGSLQAVLADGLGNSEFFPVSDWFPPAGRMKIARKWRLVMDQIRRKAARRRRRLSSGPVVN